MTAFLLVLMLAQAATEPSRPESAVQQLFEAGRYAQLLELVARTEGLPPTDRYLAGQAALRLKPPDPEQARTFFETLGTDDEDAWTWVGRSAIKLAERATEEAVSAAESATMLAPDSFMAHYQHGLALAAAKRWTEAASAFERATTLDPWFAYGHYHAGMAYYQVKRFDRMVNFLERFIKLAPEAPERPAVESLLRTVRR